MLIVMDAHATAEQIEQVCRVVAALGYSPHAMPGPTRTAIGITGNRGPIVEADTIERLPGVRELISVTAPYKLVSREFREADTVVRVGEALGAAQPAEIGGGGDRRPVYGRKSRSGARSGAGGKAGRRADAAWRSV
jgi:3-deoxy-7-phosphoheptulonate synthase